MAGFRDFLMRFRPVGSPGPAATGVPADRAAELTAELLPVFSLLEQAEAEAQRIRADAERRARRRAQAADRLANMIVSQARDRAPGVRSESARAALDRSEAETKRYAAAAERDLLAMRRRAGERMPALVERVVAEVSAGLRGQPDQPDQPDQLAQPRQSGGPGEAPGVSGEGRSAGEQKEGPWVPDG